jgi:predicted Zn-dependent protease
MGSSYGGQGRPRRGFGGIRWWILILFAGYCAWQWFGSAKVDPYTGEKAHYGATAEEEVQLGTQAFQQVVGEANAQGALLPPDAQVSRQIREIAQRLVARVPQVNGRSRRAVRPAGADRSPELPVGRGGDPVRPGQCVLPAGRKDGGLHRPASDRAEPGRDGVVMGHEIAHALLRHGSQRMAQQKLVQMGQMAAGVALGRHGPATATGVMAALGAGAQYGLILPVRTQPREPGRPGRADARRGRLLQSARGDSVVGAHVATGRRERPPEFASTHPDPANRIAHLQSMMPQAEQYYAKYCQGKAPLR